MTPSVHHLAHLLVICLFLCGGVTASFAQVGTRFFLDSNEDTVRFQWPPPDTAYSRRALIVKFHQGSLNESLLCYNYFEADSLDTLTISPAHKSMLMAQRFYIDSGIVSNTTLRSRILAMGGLYLERITCANPCEDTLSITRLGDTIESDDYNWMLLVFDNDTASLVAYDTLPNAFYNDIAMVGLNYYGTLDSRTPRDANFNNEENLDMMGVPDAWNSQTGNYGVRVAVIDDGIDYTHCDLGGAIGAGQKVSGGWNYHDGNRSIQTQALHGTQMAGIIGALTDNVNCTNHTTEGVAGIAGGWAREDKIGVQLIGFNILRPAVPYQTTYARAIGAMREASAHRPYRWAGLFRRLRYGYQASILNNSWSEIYYSEPLKSAVHDAYLNGATVVASRGNNNVGGNQDQSVMKYPASFEPQQWVLNIIASDQNKHKIGYSYYGGRADLIAPGGYLSETEGSTSAEWLNYTTEHNSAPSDYGWANGTSAAAANTSGVIALLRSERADFPNVSWWKALAVEDFEGMLKATADDLATGSFEQTGYDLYTGWGFVQANRLFQWLDLGYTVTHFNKSALDNDVTFEQWGPMVEVQFVRGSYGTIFGLRPKWGVKRRLVTSTFTLPDNWDLNGRDLYAWGYGGSAGKGGWPRVSAGYLYQSSETIVEGAGGNGLEFGIKLDATREIVVSGYQYEVFDITSQQQAVSQGLYPATAQMYLSYSVFGKPKIENKRDDHYSDGASGVSDGASDDLAVSISPNPASDYLIIEARSPFIEILEVELFNAQGQSVGQETITSVSAGKSTTVSIKSLPAGAYSCIVSSASSRKRIPFVILR